MNMDYNIRKKPSLFCSQRLILASVGFLMFFQLYAQRIGMSVAIVCMVNHTSNDLLNMNESHSFTHHNKSTSELKCGSQNINDRNSISDGPFVYSKNLQGHILGSFFYGYLVSQIPGGLLAEQVGSKWVLAGSMSLSTLATLLTPLAAKIHEGLLLFVRVLCGIGSGTLYPAMHAMWGQWAPPMERTTLCGLTYAGTMMGNVVALPLSGLLCKYGFSDKWDSIFYVIGISSVFCIVAWCVFTSNTPETHQRISIQEKKFILDSLRAEGASQTKTDLRKVPWKAFFTSKAVWALIIANFSTDWGLYTYLTNIPTFYKEILFFDISSNGFFSALPFLGLWAVMNIAPLIADKLQTSNMMSTVVTRKTFNTIGLVGPAIFLVTLSFIDCTQTAVAVVLLVSAVSISGFVFSGYLVNHMDIAPQFAGTLMGVANGIAAIAGFLAPYVAATLTQDKTRESWQKVFFIASFVYVLGAILFILLASAEIQPWAKDPQVTMPMMKVDGEEDPKSDKSTLPMI